MKNRIEKQGATYVVYVKRTDNDVPVFFTTNKKQADDLLKALND